MDGFNSLTTDIVLLLISICFMVWQIRKYNKNKDPEFSELLYNISNRANEKLKTVLLTNTHPLLYDRVIASLILEELDDGDKAFCPSQVKKIITCYWKSFVDSNLFNSYQSLFPDFSKRDLLRDFYSQCNSTFQDHSTGAYYHKSLTPSIVTSQLNDFFHTVDMISVGTATPKYCTPMSARLEAYDPETLSVIVDYIKSNCTTIPLPSMSIKLYILEWVAKKTTSKHMKIVHCLPKNKWIVSFKWDSLTFEASAIKIILTQAQSITVDSELSFIIDDVLTMLKKQSYRSLINQLFTDNSIHEVTYTNNFTQFNIEAGDFKNDPSIVDLFSHKQMEYNYDGNDVVVDLV